MFALSCNPSICNRSHSCLSPKNGCNIKSHACKTKKSSCGWEGEARSLTGGSTWLEAPFQWTESNPPLEFQEINGRSSKTVSKLRIRLEESMEYTLKFMKKKKTERSQACTHLVGFGNAGIFVDCAQRSPRALGPFIQKKPPTSKPLLWIPT